MAEQQHNFGIEPPVTGYISRKADWDTGDLIRRCCNALDIAKKTITLLADDGYIDPDDAGNHIYPEKIIGETGLLLLVMSMVSLHKQIAERVEDIACVLAPYARKEKTFMDMCLQPALAFEYAQAHIFLTNMGYPDYKFDALLSKSIDAHANFGRERTPHRMLEQVWIKKLWNDKTQCSDHHVNKIIANSALNKPIDLLHGTKDDMYAFTHALMYATNFNNSPRRMPRKRTEIISEAEAMLARCLDEKDYDLTGEILLAWPLTGNTWNTVAAFAFRVLTSAEDETGYLPPPGLRVETFKKLEGTEREKYLNATIYHTAYVMGLLCAISLMPGKIPPKNVPVKRSIPGAAARILPFLNSDPKTKQWRVEFDKMTPREQDSLAGLLFNIELIRNVRQKQYGTVYTLLGIAFEIDLADTAMARQTAELLDRLSLLA
ncbi:MAG TPA: hypothetical protein VGN20_03550 [Mucilaginibacter sp.]|jgi:hypothetical protein